MLGIDVSKRTLTCTLFEASTQRALWTREVANDATGLAQLLALTPPRVPWALEPTGRYSHTVAYGASAAGRQVLLAQPKKAKHFLNSRQSRAKTDRLDSYGLGLYALSQALPPYPLKAAMVEQLDQLLTARRGLSQAIASLQQRRAELPAAAPQLQAALVALNQQRTGLDRAIRQLVNQAGAIQSDPCVATGGPPSSPAVAPEWAAGAAPPSPPAPTELARAVATLQQVPGIGPVTAATLASRLSSHQFRRSDQFVAYCGLDIDIRQSGQKQGNRGLTKQGDGELRRLLYLAAQANLRQSGSPFASQYQRERAKGLSSTAALNAVARKLARLCWSLVTHGQCYDPARVYQQPANPAPPLDA